MEKIEVAFDLYGIFHSFAFKIQIQLEHVLLYPRDDCSVTFVNSTLEILLLFFFFWTFMSILTGK